MLHRLKTSGWKKPNSVDINFTVGMNAIVGPNYTGKSSLISAILFALGGASVVAGSKMETVGFTGKFSVELWFLKYYVIRTKSKAELYEEGTDEPIAVGTSVVNRRISLILGMPVKRFIDLKVARQKKTDKILSMGGTELFKIIQELTGITEVETVINKVNLRSKVTEGALENIQVTPDQLAAAEELISPLQELIKLTSEKLEVAKEKLQQASKNVKAVRDSLEVSTELWSDYKEKNKLRQQNQENLQDLLERKKTVQADQAACQAALPHPTLEKCQEELDGARRFLSHLDSLRQKSNSLDRDRSQKATRQADKQSKVDKLRVQLSAAEKKLDGFCFVPGDHAAVEKSLSEVSSNLAVLKAEAASLIQSLKTGVCPACKRAYEGEEKHLKEAKERLEALDVAIPEVEWKLEKLNSSKQAGEATRSLENEVASVRSSLEEQEVELANLKMETETAVSELTEVREELLTEAAREEGFKKKEQALDTNIKSMNKVILRLAEIDRQETQLVQALEKTPEVEQPSIAKPDELRPLLTEALQEEVKYRGEEKELTSSLSAAQSKMQLAAAALENLRSSMARREVLESRQGVELALLKYLRTSRDRFTQDLWSQFLIRASQFVRECTDGRVTDLDRDEKGEFKYLESGNWFSLDEASGCQLNLMGLAIQMALADVASCPLNILLADEPTDSMEDEHSLAAMMALSTCGKQVVCVTHKDLDRSLFNNVIELERK